MKKYLFFALYFLLFTFYLSVAQNKHRIKITVDTKKMTNIDCNLGSDGEGGPSSLKRVYLHSGLCTKSETYCTQQITPYGSQVWEHVVGNWGANPLDDGVGLMTVVGNGVYSLEYVIEDYYSDLKLVNSEWNDAHTIQSTPMPAGATPYVIGFIFRDPTGAISGRDDNCYDLFITGINKLKPQVIQSYDLGAAFPAVKVEESIETDINEQLSTKNEQLTISPNPFNESAQISINLKKDYQDIALDIINIAGQKVKNLFNGSIAQGPHSFTWDGYDSDGKSIANGMYLFTIKSSGSILSAQRVILNK